MTQTGIERRLRDAVPTGPMVATSVAGIAIGEDTIALSSTEELKLFSKGELIDVSVDRAIQKNGGFGGAIVGAIIGLVIGIAGALLVGPLAIIAGGVCGAIIGGLYTTTTPPRGKLTLLLDNPVTTRFNIELGADAGVWHDRFKVIILKNQRRP